MRTRITLYQGALDVDSIVAELESRLRDAMQGIQADVEWAVG